MTRPSWIGQALGGRYRIDDILGQGGMSAVYKAYDPNLKRVVAVKMIHTHLAEDPKFVIRFEEEAAAVAQLRHPNIVQVFDFNHDNDLYYMVQEFIAGETLQERLRRLNKSNRRMPLDEAIGFISNICEAAGYAHQRGLVHRDIKPANIMIDTHNQAILMDFGIVKITGGEKHTATGAVVGTALYLPPELIRGEMPDARSDQYSLGVTLFEAVNGRPPYEADSAMTLMMMHLNDPLPDLHTLRPDIPQSLVAVIEKALAKNRADRYASMAEFAAALRDVKTSLSSAAPAATLADQPAAQTVQPSVGATYPASAPAAPQQPAAKPSGSGRPTPQAASASEKFSGTQPPRTTPVQPGAAPTSKRISPLMWGGIAGAVFLALILGIFLLRQPDKTNPPPTQTLAAAIITPTAETGQAPAQTTATPAAAVAIAIEPSPTHTQPAPPSALPGAPPSAPPSIAPSPTPTIPAGVPYARINKIEVNENGVYVVDYETFTFSETLPGQHVHFFFNTVPPQQAGVPGSGPWILYGGPRPFSQYRVSDRPKSATQMCILVANAGHGVLPDSGNCFILPDVPVAAPLFTEPCLAGPGAQYPALKQLDPGKIVLVKGISADEAWWSVENPDDPGQICWLPRSRSDFSGDLSTLPLAEAPELPAGPSVQITNITLDAQGRYLVEFSAGGFTPALPGTHIHFFFDIFAAEQLSSAGSGNRLMYGGASPFSGFTQAALPQGAAQICALVANPDHSVLPGSGNCFALP